MRPPSLIELNLMLFDTGLTHLGSEASNYVKVKIFESLMAKIVHIIYLQFQKKITVTQVFKQYKIYLLFACGLMQNEVIL